METTLIGRAVFGLVLAGTLCAVPAEAQVVGDGFLLREPAALLTVRGGYTLPRARSDIYSFLEQELTLGRGDFNAATVAFDLSFHTTDRTDLAIGLGWSRSSAGSEFRNWLDQDNHPIEQRTTLQTVPFTASLRYYLAPRGRRIGRLAWIPARVAPYVGLGGGMVWYRFRQHGDFVDAQSLAVFKDDFTSGGRSLVGTALAGANVAVSPRWALTGELRYSHATAELKQDFVNFQRIDLSGLSFTAGISYRLVGRGAR